MANDSKQEKKKISKQSFLNALQVFSYIKPHSFLFGIGLLLLVVSGLLVIVITALLGQLLGQLLYSLLLGLLLGQLHGLLLWNIECG